MANFWDFSVWGGINIIAVLLLSLLVANMLKRKIKFLQASLIPTAVLGGIILLIISAVYNVITDKSLFDCGFFGGDGANLLELITYHTLALGFIATTLRGNKRKFTKQRTVEIFNTGVTTVATYLLQAVFGMGITLIVAYFIVPDFFPAAGVLLPFGYGQGSGQALNYGSIYEADYGFVGGRSFGLTIAALGFLSASIGGVIHLNIMKKRRNMAIGEVGEHKIYSEEIQKDNEIPMNGSMDKITVQTAIVVATYFLTHVIMYVLGILIPGFRSVIYGFNFLIGVLMATLVKAILSACNKKQIIKRQYTNDFLLERISNMCFDVMVVAGIAAIRLDVLKNYWIIALVLGVVGLVITYFYNSFIAKKFFAEYSDEQFLAMYGMLTGTMSTGIILLREADPDYKTPASDNLVYQNFPAMVFGFPLMLLATLAPKQPILTWIILLAFFLVMNLILFRSVIFKKRKKK